MTEQPVKDLAERLAGIDLFADQDPDQLRWLGEVGRPVSLDDGQVVFRDGEPALYLYVILEGGLLMTKVFAGQEQVLSRHSAADPAPGDSHDKPAAANQFTGELPLLTGGDYMATATTLGPTRLVAYDRPTFFAMLERCPKVFRVLMPVLAWRIHAHELQAGRSVMLAGLNTLAAGLAHELNNPMSAAVRGASRLHELLPELTDCAQDWGGLATPPERAALAEVATRVTDGAVRRPGGVLEASEAADAVDDWLDEHGQSDIGMPGDVLAGQGVGVGQLDQLAGHLRPEALPAAVRHLTLLLEVGMLVNDVAEGARRVQELVLSTKDYTNMDRAPERDVELEEGLEATLIMLGPQLSGITVHREYADVPKVSVFPGEINQVWTNLIQNALDAMAGSGDLTLTLCVEGPSAVVEIRDTGPGIPDDVLPYVFQPFFTTRKVGQATGMGLHVSRETVTVRHQGSLDIRSEPGDTRVTVRLPLAGRPKSY